MKIEQVAFATKDTKALIDIFKTMGLKDWADDEVKATGFVFGVAGENKAELHFNYDFGFELEILNYLEGPNWHEKRNSANDPIFLSHLGLHVEKEELKKIANTMKTLGIGIAQEVYTDSHTNPAVKGIKRFHYVVFDSQEKLGFDLKLIERIFV